MKSSRLVSDETMQDFDGPRAARPEEMAAVLALVNETFANRARFRFRMEEKFPNLFHTSNREHVRVICHENRPVSVANYLPTELVFGGACVPIAFIGAVCTEPRWRGLGLSTRLLDDIEEKARQEGIQLLFISGARGLYLRRQCAIVGGFLRYTVSPQDLPVPFELEADPLNCMADLHRLYVRELVRFERSPDAFSTLLRAGLIADYNNTYRLYVTRQKAGISSYLVLRTVHDDPLYGEIVEYAGARADIALALPLIAQRAGLTYITLITPKDDPIVGHLKHFGKPERQLGTIKILHPQHLLDTLSLTFSEFNRSDSSTNAITLSEGRDGIIIHCGDDRINVGDLAGMSQFLFGVPQEENGWTIKCIEQEKILARQNMSLPILPIHLPYAGNLNYI